jgi:primosomal protein N' (replication factor Y)
MDNNLIYIDVILPVPLNRSFTYYVSGDQKDNAVPGKRVIVQFGARKLYTGIIKKVYNNSDTSNIKPVDSIIDDSPIVSPQCFPLWEWIAEYYCCSEGEVMKAALPSGLKLESQTKLTLNPDWIETTKLTDIEESVYQFLCSQNSTSVNDINSLLKKANSYNIVKSLLAKGAIFVEEEINERYKPKTIAYIRVAEELKTEEDFKNAFDQLKRAQKQLELFMLLLNELNHFAPNRKEHIEKKELFKTGNSNEAVLKGLLQRGFVKIENVKVDRINENTATRPHVRLNEFQEESINNIYGQFKTKNVVLLHGITASGKTEIYIKLIEDQLKAGKQVLYLLPEIAITSQIIERLKNVFGNKAGIYHSKFNDSERVEIWNKVLNFDIEKQPDYQLILGTRSSLFIPFKNLGLIIVDEEHENSYKQFEPSPRYNARDAAVVLANLHDAKVLMGTATPSFETYLNCKTGKYGYVFLNKRHMETELPEVLIADIADAYKRKKMKSHFTPLLFDEMQNALERNEQVILFQNRRGFSPYIQCKDCGWIPKCKNCDVSLSYHKSQNYIQCHYCGYTSRLPEKCENCNSDEIQTKGFGTEKIEDELKIFFPEASIGRLDTDASKAKSGHEKIIEKFAQGKTQILIGTQMVTKGLDFKNVSLVGILNADNIFNFPDFRSHERAYQLMVQVSGRAGRNIKRGKVIIQTFQPEHPVIKMVLNNDYNSFFERHIIERKVFMYPPWFRLINITVKHKNQERTLLAAKQLVAELNKNINAKILGPEYPAVGRISQYFQMMIRIKLEKNHSVSNAKKDILKSIDKVKQTVNNGPVIFNIDVDPL